MFLMWLNTLIRGFAVISLVSHAYAITDSIDWSVGFVVSLLLLVFGVDVAGRLRKDLQ